MENCIFTNLTIHVVALILLLPGHIIFETVSNYLFIYLFIGFIYRTHVLTPRSSWQVRESGV